MKAQNTMNIDKLKQAENDFLTRYPGGFENQELVEIRKKHRLDKMHAFAKDAFNPGAIQNTARAADNLSTIISRASLVSVFEKMKFKDFMKVLDSNEKSFIINALYELLHGNNEQGFNELAQMLSRDKLAKWTLMTIVPVYYAPDKNVFIKPTTTKKIIEKLELKDLQYKPTPTYDFYARYSKTFNAMKKEVDPSLTPNNPAFSGFLMMSL